MVLCCHCSNDIGDGFSFWTVVGFCTGVGVGSDCGDFTSLGDWAADEGKLVEVLLGKPEPVFTSELLVD
jgi:hypothetical protein